ncbi:NRDE-2, necessary for RNA interference-domain-containing protein [Glomus cerebriforme]|uniref:NRDE-2, necessary for RNA interference-domain-containing protein n=1 Tax=Glomus cerebriforme TaxID=658196 RepID=A0A397TUL5_9GLOM|nr:NRDE-2, necessary for RNA interference-domain-containing protein [Glomus cerebriforme]
MDKKPRKDKKEKKKEKKEKGDREFTFQAKQDLSEEDIRQKIKDYDIKLDQNPHDVSLWLEFIAFQDKAMQFSVTSKKLEATKTSINEVKLSIFDKALQLNPKNSWLLVEYLKCCEQIYDVPKLLTKWDEILTETPGDIILWMQYIDFRQTNLVSFNVAQCLQVFEDCLHVLRKSVLVATDYNEKLRIERIMIHVFQRACVFILQSGYSERAYACWQAMIELVFFAPDHLRQQTFYDRVTALEVFWEAEWPRFGEDEAKGWAYYVEQSDNEMQVAPTPANSINVSNLHGDIYEKWAKAEEMHNGQLLSIRTGTGGDDDINVDDPYRIVIFDDIRTFLFDVTFPQSYIELLYACFSFVGLTFNPGYSSSNPLITDTFLNTKLVNESIANNSFWETRLEENNLFKFPIKSFPQIEDNLFKSQSWFCICDEVDVINVDMKFARNAFYQLRQVVNDTGIKLCRLAVEHLYDMSSGRSLAKSMLKREKMNLALWNGYAQVERSSNKFTEARKVYLGAIAQIRSYPEQFQIDAPLLHRMFAEMELEQGHHKTAMNILVLLTEEQGNIESIAEVDVSVTRLLKARKYYAQQIARSTTTISQYESGNSLHYCVCYALLECLSQNLQQASKIFEEMIQDIEMRKGYLDLEAELIFMAYVKLIYQYSNLFASSSSSTSSNANDRLLQDVLTRAIKAFPNNTIFLSMYFYLEVHERISVGLNSILEEILQKNPSHIIWTFVLYSELNRQPFNVKRVRSLFDRALECSKTKSSISLWILYINFEMTYGRHDIAKTLYYRAVRECPWSKDLYMLAFRKLCSLFTIDELEEAMNVLYEKEIRLRVSIDKFDDKQEMDVF